MCVGVHACVCVCLCVRVCENLPVAVPEEVVKTILKLTSAGWSI